MAKTAATTANNFQPPSYQKGFNYGYLLAKHSPELLNRLLPALEPSNDYLKAIKSGKEQYDKEQKTKSKGAINTPLKDKGHDLDKDR